MQNFDHIIKAFVGAVLRVQSQCFDRLDIAAQFVNNKRPSVRQTEQPVFRKNVLRLWHSGPFAQ